MWRLILNLTLDSVDAAQEQILHGRTLTIALDVARTGAGQPFFRGAQLLLEALYVAA